MNTSKTFIASFTPKPFSMIAKPIGAVCNLNCTYCYYLEKKNLYSETKNFKMSDEVLEEFTRQFIQSQALEEINFVWQGGEPLLLGIVFYEKALFFQNKYAGNKTITNSIQTNGTLLNEEWCKFLNCNNFLTGISIDGTEKIHNHFRITNDGSPTFHKVLHGINLLKKYKVEFNTLLTVNAYNVDFPLEIYHFLKSIDSHFIQFIPVVERIVNDSENEAIKLTNSSLPENARVTEWSVNAEKYGKFLIEIFNEWVVNDVGEFFVQLFDSTLATYLGLPSGICMFQPECGQAGAIEFNGDVYSCDHFVFPQNFLGNIFTKNLNDLMNSVSQQIFGQNKFLTLPQKCKNCNFLKQCFGECPKKRFLFAENGEYGLNYLCEAYKMFFSHTAPVMRFMANELINRRAPQNVMYWARNNGN